MARNALQGCVSPGQWEGRAGMIKECRLPGRCRMTREAIVVKISRHVIGIRGGRKITGVTGVAVTAGVGVTGSVTADACQTGVPSGQRKPGGIVIKGRRRPGRRIVTALAVLVKIICGMIRVGGRRKVALMTTEASIAGSGIGRCMTACAIR